MWREVSGRDRYTKIIPDLSLRDGAFEKKGPPADERWRAEREAEEVDGVKENTGCVTDMSFLYTPEYFQQVFHMNRKAHSSTNKFFFVFFYT